MTASYPVVNLVSTLKYISKETVQIIIFISKIKIFS